MDKESKQNLKIFIAGLSLIAIAFLALQYVVGHQKPLPEYEVAPVFKQAQAEAPTSLEQLCDLDAVVCPYEENNQDTKSVLQAVESETKDAPLSKSNVPASIKSNPVAIQIYAIAKEENFQWPDYLVRLAFAESSLNPKAINRNTNGTTDRGVMQWNSVHRNISDECAFSVDCSVRLAIKTINDGKQGIWVADAKVRNQKFN